MSAAPPFPFRGIRGDRPYPVTGLTTARWVTEVDLDVVHLHQLWLTQDSVRVAALFGLTDPTRFSDAYPHVVAYDGELYLEDGHHRVLRAYFLDAAPAQAMRVLRRERP